MLLPLQVENPSIYFTKPLITCWFGLLWNIVCIAHVLLQLRQFCSSNFIVLWIKQAFYGTSFSQKSGTQYLNLSLLILIINLGQFVFLFFWWWLLHYLISTKTMLVFLNVTVFTQQFYFLVTDQSYKIWYPPRCIIWRSATLSWCFPSNARCG